MLNWLDENFKTMLNAADMGADIVSEAIDMKRFLQFGIIWTATGTPTGTLLVQFSNDGITWVDSATMSTALSGSGATSFFNGINSNVCAFDKLRLKYTRSSGSGSITATIQAKG